MKQSDLDLLLAKAQIAFTAILLVSIIALVFVLVLFRTQLSETGTTIITSVIAALITILTLQMNFFYARTRPSALPDPNSPPSAPTLALSVSPGDPNASPPSVPSATATSTPASTSAAASTVVKSLG